MGTAIPCIALTLFFFFKDTRVFATHVWVDRLSIELQSNREVANGHDVTKTGPPRTKRRRDREELMGQNEAGIGRKQ